MFLTRQTARQTETERRERRERTMNFISDSSSVTRSSGGLSVNDGNDYVCLLIE